jgi:hypothetical protein
VRFKVSAKHKTVHVSEDATRYTNPARLGMRAVCGETSNSEAGMVWGNDKIPVPTYGKQPGENLCRKCAQIIKLLDEAAFGEV